MLDKSLYLLSKLIEALLIIISTGIVSVVTVEVVMRKFFSTSLIFTEELARYSMVWLVFLGSAIAVRDGSHIRINALTKRFSDKAQGFIALAAYGLTLFFIVILTIESIKILPQQFYQFCITMDVPMFWFYLAMPVGCVLMALFMLPKLRSIFRGEYIDESIRPAERGGEEC